MLLFGGMDQDGNFLGDTWEWDGNGWREASQTGPAPRSGQAMTFDAHRRRVILFGGENENGALADTWEWDGNGWQQIAAVAAPPPRSSHQIIYDAARRQVLMFGGLDYRAGRTYGDTWLYDGRAWTPVKVAGPAPRFHHVMVYDAARSRLVLFGGNLAEPPLNFDKFKAGSRGDTWEWNGKGWTQISATGPARRDHHAMAYDAARRKTILFGGFSEGKYLGDTWEWEGKIWRQMAASGPEARGGKPGMAYDVARRRIMLFGGGAPGAAMGDLWEWNGKQWRRAVIAAVAGDATPAAKPIATPSR
ncbi:MAG: hypothetical protein HY231_11200 [Acidobacteria bacterium]|nr:hypothetical protein [Acidobacteriota bacterium]